MATESPRWCAAPATRNAIVTRSAFSIPVPRLISIFPAIEFLLLVGHAALPLRGSHAPPLRSQQPDRRGERVPDHASGISRDPHQLSVEERKVHGDQHGVAGMA